ncbi:MAG: tyrosine-type recombinase/integrase [Cyanobacteria bacterium P01_D01_bin.156]
MAKPDPQPTFIEFQDGSPKAKKPTVHQLTREPDWVDRFLEDRELRPNTKKIYTRQLRQFQQWLTGRGWSDVTAQDLTNYKTHLKTTPKTNSLDETLSPASINQALASIQSFFKWLTAKRLIHYNPALSLEKVTDTPSQVKDLEVSIIQTLEEVLPFRGERYSRDRAIFELLKHGLRANEVAARNVGDYDNQSIIIQGAKWGSDGVVPLSSQACEALDSYLGWCLREGFDTNADAPLFISLSNRNRGKRMGYKGVYNCIKDLAELADLDEKIHPHQLRHTFGTQLILEGMNPEFVRRLMRIKSMEVFGRYTKRALELKAKESFYTTLQASKSGLFGNKNQ